MVLPLTKQSLELRRNAAELRAFVNQVFAEARSDPHEFKLGAKKTGLYKDFLDEFVPLGEFAELAYPIDYKFQWVHGSQGYDALVFDRDGNEVDRIEFARPHDGALRGTAGKQLADGHAGWLGAEDYDKPLEGLLAFVKSSAASKSVKDYSGITLVFAPIVHSPLPALEHHFERQIKELEQLIAERHFTAKRVFLVVLGRLITVHPERAC